MKIRVKEIPAYFFIYLTSAFYILRNSNLNFSGMEIVLLIAVAAGFAYVVIDFGVKSRHTIWLFILIVLIILTMIRSSDTRMIVSFVAILVGMRMEHIRMLKALFGSHILFFAIVMITGSVGHINGAAMQCGVLLFLYLIIENSKLDTRRIIMLWGVYLVSAVYTKSGSLIVCMGVSLILVSTLKYRFIRNFLTGWISKYIYPIILACNVFACLWTAERYFPRVRLFIPVIGNGITFVLEKIDELTLWRLTLGAESLYRYGVSLFGGNVKFDLHDGSAYTYFNLDSGMLWLLQGWGILMTVIVLVLMTFMMKSLIDEKKYYSIIVGISIALWAANEDMLLSISVNFMFFILGETLSKRMKNRNLEAVHEYS